MNQTTSTSILFRNIFEMIKNSRTDQEVVSTLLPSGRPYLFERHMWDYKQELPILSSNGKPLPDDKQTFDAKYAEIAKDAVAFYNTYGGYLVIGVNDNPREIVGFDKHFNCDDFNKKLRAITKHDIECFYFIHDVLVNHKIFPVGLLFIPQRRDSIPPAQFHRDAPESQSGKKAYRQGDIYFRQADQCRAAKSADEFAFLCSEGRRDYLRSSITESRLPLSNNLIARDPGFIRFVGRSNDLNGLWEWLLDPYSPAKVLAGVGGIGKTTIAREFAEQLVKSPPFGFERVIWFSAKERFYTAVLGKYVPTMRVDFEDSKSLLCAILKELGHPESLIDSEWTDNELIEEVIESLKLFPSVIIVDDVDSLPSSAQQDLFHKMLTITSRSITSSGVSPRVLLTARLDLGAAPSQVIRVDGLNLDDFAEYVQMTAESLGLASLKSEFGRLMKEFYQASSGSPTFAASILRIVSLGQPLGKALATWKGSDGEGVRKFAFEKELNTLSDSQIKTLFALCILGQASQIELKNIMDTNETLLIDDLTELRKYHLVSTGGKGTKGGSDLTVPSWIPLLKNLIKTKIINPAKIEQKCARARRESPDVEGEVGKWIHRVLALWRDNKPNDALEAAKQAKDVFPSSPDIRCLLGRAYLKALPPSPRWADASFRKAFELKCTRLELLDLWVEAKKGLGDWNGILDITQTMIEDKIDEKTILHRCKAYYQLAEIAFKSGDYRMSSQRLDTVLREIEKIIKDGLLSTAPSYQLRSMRSMLYDQYIISLEKSPNGSAGSLRIWNTVMKGFRQRLLFDDLLYKGLDDLEKWWEGIEWKALNHDGVADEYSLSVMADCLSEFSNVIEILKKQAPQNDNFVESMIQKRALLHEKVKAYNLKFPNTIPTSQ